jgi:hypothetical protein
MMPASVRIKSSGAADVEAFIRIAGEDTEATVTWRPGSWRCDIHGVSEAPRCAHARALANSDAYAHHFHDTRRTR